MRDIGEKKWGYCIVFFFCNNNDTAIIFLPLQTLHMGTERMYQQLENNDCTDKKITVYKTCQPLNKLRTPENK